MNNLQSFVFSDVNKGIDDNFFFRKRNEVGVFVEDMSGRLIIGKWGVVSFDTYMNAFNVDYWRRNCNIEKVFLFLSGAGQVRLRIGLHRVGVGHRWIASKTMALSAGDIALDIVLNELPPDGLMYAEVTALEDVILDEIIIQTNQSKLNMVRLGVVVTHYKRETEVVLSISRLAQDIISSSFKDKISVFVIDNSRSLPPLSRFVTIIENKNVGGSGGFTRGMIAAEEAGCTHCLFMDDDASCITESLFRTISAFEFCVSPKLAISGALFFNAHATTVHERGAQFDGNSIPLEKGADVCHLDTLVRIERNDKRIDYGGWWYFAFRISDVSRFPFPIFVRGDDLLFPMQNKMSVTALNGVCAWSDPFGTKSGPLTNFLGCRSTFFLMIAFLGKSRFSIARKMISWYWPSLFSFNYSSANSIVYSIGFLSLGRRAWIDDAELLSARRLINASTYPERMERLNLDQIDFDCINYRPSRWRRFLRWMTLNGLLLPSAIMRSRPVFQRKDFHARFGEIAFAKEVLYYDDYSGTGYLAKEDKGAAILSLFKFLFSVSIFLTKFMSVKREQEAALSQYTTREFWYQYLDLKPSRDLDSGK